MKSAVLWDWDGTLADTSEISKFYVNEVRRQMGQNVLNDAEYEVQARGPFDYWDIYGDKRREALDLFHDLYRDGVSSVTLFESIKGLVKWLHAKKIKQYVISNKREDTLLAEVGKSDIAIFFENIIGTGLHDGLEKPHPDMLKRALNGAHFSKMIMIGDTATDLKFAYNIGAVRVFVDSPFRAGMAQEKPHYSFKKHAHMGQWLKDYIRNGNI